MQKYYRTIIWLVVLIVALSLVVVIFSQEAQIQNSAPVACTQEAKICPDGSSVGRTGPDCAFAPCPGAATSTPPMTVVTQSDSNMTIELKKDQNFVINLGSLKWNFIFSPTGIIGRISDTPDGTGQGIYQALRTGVTTLHGTGAPICKPGQMCPDFMEAMTITFVVE